MPPVFRACEQAPLIDRVLLDIQGLPAGYGLRTITEADGAAFLALAPSIGDTIRPMWGTRPADWDGLTLALTKDGRVVGHVSGDIEVREELGDLVMGFDGIFLDEDHRGQGLSRPMAEAFLQVAEAWRVEQGLAPGWDFGADTLSGSAGEAVALRMMARLRGLEDAALEATDEGSEPAL